MNKWLVVALICLTTCEAFADDWINDQNGCKAWGNT